jgi:hypothetical protein
LWKGNSKMCLIFFFMKVSHLFLAKTAKTQNSVVKYHATVSIT